MNGLSLVGGNVFSLTDDGLPSLVVPLETIRPTGTTRPLLMVHGFRYDPRQSNNDNPHLNTFRYWDQILRRDHESFGFGWYSVPAGPTSALKAWAHGRWNTYRWAWDLARDASEVFGQVVDQCEQKPDIICHSLGSRVVLEAFRSSPHLNANRVLILNGAEYASTALEVAEAHPRTKFFNVVVRTDDVLSKFGALFAPGRGYSKVVGQIGLGNNHRPNWTDIVLDHPLTHSWGKTHGWNLRGNNPAKISDHWYSYRFPGNWNLYQDIFMGAELHPPKV